MTLLLGSALVSSILTLPKKRVDFFSRLSQKMTRLSEGGQRGHDAGRWSLSSPDVGVDIWVMIFKDHFLNCSNFPNPLENRPRF